MNVKKSLIVAIAIVTVAVAYYLLSPLWNVIERDDAFPSPIPSLTPAFSPAIDGIGQLSPEKRKAFEEQMAAMKDQVMLKDERLAGGAPTVITQAPLVASAHDVQGKVLLIDQPDGKILRFEQLDTINGPDLRIYLSTGLDVKDAVDLGPIRATKGNVNYVVPAETDTSRYDHVLIWCRQFGVLFSYARLS